MNLQVMHELSWGPAGQVELISFQTSHSLQVSNFKASKLFAPDSWHFTNFIWNGDMYEHFCDPHLCISSS